jgi:hypothetical protein
MFKVLWLNPFFILKIIHGNSTSKHATREGEEREREREIWINVNERHFTLIIAMR